MNAWEKLKCPQIVLFSCSDVARQLGCGPLPRAASRRPADSPEARNCRSFCVALPPADDCGRLRRDLQDLCTSSASQVAGHRA